MTRKAFSFLILVATWILPFQVQDEFVHVPGGTFRHGVGANQSGALVRVDDFEIGDRPVTNREYEVFVRETGSGLAEIWGAVTDPYLTMRS